MKAHLMYRDRDFDVKQVLPDNAALLEQDLELPTLLQAMANEDEFVLGVAHTALLSSLENDVDTVVYRQAILRDCLDNSPAVRELYEFAAAAIEATRKNSWGGRFSHLPSAILHGSVDLLQMYVGLFKTLRGMAEAQAGRFSSGGFTTLFTMLQQELGDDYLAQIECHLEQLRFKKGVLESAEVGRGNAGTNYVLRSMAGVKTNWIDRLFGRGPPAFTFQIADRDQAGANALTELRDQGIHLAANALAQSVDHIVSFFAMLRTELAFYIGCLNLHEQLLGKGEVLSLPGVAPAGERQLSITGANQGGKSSFLRSIGLAQLMLQSGMFVGAQRLSGRICTGLFTHYKREEDKSLKSGKFDEELVRMGEIVDKLKPDSLVLFNESFAATNEREGSQIASQIVRALLDRRIEVFYVTHMFALARGLFEQKRADALFLRADRRDDGSRSFRLVPGEPLSTSFGEDLYLKIFGTALEEPLHA